jgi:hypothetical protein
LKTRTSFLSLLFARTGFSVLLAGFSGALLAQNNRPDQAAVVASFKQNIQDVLKEKNSKRGPEHVELVPRSVATPAPPVIVRISGKGRMAGHVLKDGSPCKVMHTGWCYEGFTDNSGALYIDSKGVPCNPEKHPDTCFANGVSAGAKLAAAKPIVNLLWRKRYAETLSQYGFDVKVTDSLVTPYTGVLSYDEVVWLTAEHPTEKEAEQDNSFTSSLKNSQTSTYGYQEGKWVLLK